MSSSTARLGCTGVMAQERELEIVRQQLAEAHATLDAIRSGQVDAVMVDLGHTHEVFTLQRADLPYREFIEQMAEGALSLDAKHTILYANPFVCELLGLPREEVVGQSLQRWLTPPSQRALDRAVSSGEVQNIPAELAPPLGDPVPVRLAVVPPGTHQNRRTILVVSDQRIMHQLQNVIEERDVAEAASSAKDRFLAVLGHELRNPLAALASSVELVGHESLGSEERQRIHAGMTRQLQQLQSLIDDLLDLSRVAHGKIVLKKEPVALSATIAQARESVEPQVLGKQQILYCDAVSADLVVEADRTRLEQILVNLLSNASKYTPSGGQLWLSVTPGPRRVEIVVKDSGIGLESGQTEQIFDPFVQLGEAGSGGLGIGLTLVRQLVELHGGSVAAESAGAGCGTSVRVTLPFDPALRSSRAPDGEADAGKNLGAGVRVLVVDDNEDASELLSMLLELHGMVVKVVHRGAEVARAVESHHAELVLLDLGLPDVSGYDVARQLREAGHERLVILALTGFSHADARARVNEAGFDGHLVKPLNLEHLAGLTERFRERLA